MLLWILGEEHRKISRHAAKVLGKPGVCLFVSVVSIWEILVKHHAGKLWSSVTADYILQCILARQAWRILPLEFDHLSSLNVIDSFTDHTDPFDRMLIAQATSEGLNVMTADAQFSRYKINVVW